MKAMRNEGLGVYAAKASLDAFLGGHWTPVSGLLILSITFESLNIS